MEGLFSVITVKSFSWVLVGTVECLFPVIDRGTGSFF